MENILYYIGGIVLSVIGYFLKRTIDDLDKVKQLVNDNKSKIELVENNHLHLNNKFDLLYDAVRELTQEIKSLSIQLAKK